MTIVFGVKGWVTWLSLAAVLAMGLGSYCALRNPPPPEPCVDMVKAFEDRGCGLDGFCPHPDQRFAWQDPAHTNVGAYKCRRHLQLLLSSQSSAAGRRQTRQVRQMVDAAFLFAVFFGLYQMAAILVDVFWPGDE